MKDKRTRLKTKTSKRTSPSITILRFTPTAWAKLLFLRDLGESEVGGFGICPNEPLLVEDIGMVKQTCHYTSVVFDDDAVANFFDEKVDQGMQPEQFARVWIHTHPGDCPHPSMTDEDTFDRVFGNSEWAVMFILACGGESYGRLRFNGGPTAELLLATEIEYGMEFSATDRVGWEQEYLTNVEFRDPFNSSYFNPSNRNSRKRVAELDTDMEVELFNDAYLEMLTEREEEWAYGYN